MIAFLIIFAIVALIVLIVMIRRDAKSKRSKCPNCPNCKAQYSFPDDFEFITGDLKWRKEKKTEEKGDFKYEIEYRVCDRTVTFDFKCSKCGHTHWFNRTYDLYRSDSDYSQSHEEEVDLLMHKIKMDFDKSVFEGKTVRIAISIIENKKASA